MNHGAALGIKGIMTLIVLYIVLGLVFDVSFWEVLLITVILGLISYVLGDMLILPRTSNTMATIADLGLAFVVIWLLVIALTDLAGGTAAVAALISAIVMAVGEYFFHMYIQKNNLTKVR